MILVRSPLRITLGGGGTDLPSYADQYGGFCLTAAIDRYVYVAVLKPFRPGIYLKYSDHETVETVEAVQHPIIREALLWRSQPPWQIEITTLADIPAGTGLGSSSAFTAALLQALHVHQHRSVLPRREVAGWAGDLEVQRLQAPIGLQDQYATAYGGLLAQEFPSLPAAAAMLPVLLEERVFQRLQDRLLLFYTGLTRSARRVLYHQQAATIAADPVMLEHLHCIKTMGRLAHETLLRGDLKAFGRLLHEHWLAKRERSPGMTTPQIDAWYEQARTCGALGGKLVGAGAGGCLLFYTEDPERLRAGLADSGLEEIRFRFDLEGTKVLLAS